MANNNLINRARAIQGFNEWQNDYFQVQWDSLHSRAQLLAALLTVSSSILGILSVLPNDISPMLYIRLVYFAPFLLLSLGILVGGIALYDLLNMKSRLAKEILKLLNEVLDGKGYHTLNQSSVQERKTTCVFEIVSYVFLFLSIILLLTGKILAFFN